MANKALAKRQKLSFRVEPSQKALRNPAALAARLRAPVPHPKGVTGGQPLPGKKPGGGN